MSTITVNGRTFQTSIPEAEIKQRVKELALQISKDFEGKTPLLLGVLNGAFIFAADLVRELTIPFEISFVKLASYQGTISSGKVKEIIGISENLQGRHVIIVEDIVDTGRTMHQMVESLGTRNPASVSVCSLFVKPDNMEEHVDVKYAAFTIPNKFILGYGLDFDQQARGLKDIYTLAENE